MANRELGIPDSANALARHTLQYLRLYAVDNEAEWRGEADNSTWSSSCERIHSTNSTIKTFECEIRAVQMCFTYTEDKPKRAR